MYTRLSSFSWIIYAMISLFISGCSVSYSFEKASDSVSTSLDGLSGSFESFLSISTSSGGDDDTAEQTLYRHDVQSLVAVYLREDEVDQQEFQYNLSELAKQHGLQDWWSQPSTYIGLGMGVKGQVGAEFENSLLRLLPIELIDKHRELIIKGYDLT